MYSVGNMKIGVRLGLGFALMALFMLGIGVAGWMGVSKQSVTAQHVVDQDVPYLSALATTRHNLMLLRRFEKDALINIASADKVKDYRKKWMDAREQLNASLKLAGKYAPNAEAVKRAEGISAALARYDSVFAQVMTAILAGELKSTSEGNQKIDAAKGDLHALETLITELFQDVNKQVDTLKPMLVEMEHNVSLLLVAALVAAIVAAITLAILITRSITRPLAQAVEVADAMAIGDLSKRIEIRSEDETGQLLRSMQKMVDAIRALVADAAMLSKAAVDGKLETRADATKHQGDFHRVVTGVNETLDAVIGPLNVSASYVEQISRGAIPARITDSYNGDFNTIKNNLNTCIDAVDALVADADLLSRAAVEGKLETRADATKHQGDFRKIVEGVNATLDAMIGPMNEGMRVFGALSKGDLTERITDNYQGTFQKLKEDANLTVDKLTEIVGQIKESTESINVASKEIASGNTDLSQRTEEQASSLEETASSMEELTSTVKQNAENAKQANQLAIGASDVAMKGGDVVGQVVTTMSSINESSKKIVDIIGVIDGIAFQTNILALNAAVEAARAGEQGRGFAVVATEVRNLAQRSAAAAKEIKTLIDDSVDKVGAGTKLVDEAGKTMEEIVTSIRRVTDIMAEITAASQEQSSGIEQVNTAITQMDEVTQQNAALVEEAAAAAESLEEQAGNLAQAVAMFKLGSASGGTATCATGRREAATRPANVARLPMKTAPGRHGAKKTAAEMPRPGTARDLAKVAGGADEQWEEF